MKLSLSENIRSFRKQRKMTQEKLAEALGVTVGAVYKWESGQSQPELNLLVEMADFFDTSVDVLLGYRIKDNRLESVGERINAYCRTLDPTAISEAEKALCKYPHSFRVVYECASVFLVYGAGNHDPQQLRRALELFEQSRMLLTQNDDPRISDATICGNQSTIWLLLGEQEKSIELLKKNNAGGIFSGDIGAFLSIYGDEPEEASPFLSEALLSGISNLLTAVIGYVFLFRSRNDWTSAMDILSWGIALLTGLKTENKPDILEKTLAEMLVLLAYVQQKIGMQAESVESLNEARTMALRFDSMPDYSLKAMRFVDHPDQTIVFDILGATASESITNLVSLLKDQRLADQWAETAENEQ
ncbi:MAG: helix-turn-helix transcriptional regulator [Oscillospiraceae bacterium]|nr:helix-turn-helix transcriptional regulator [Oscillospiraceae bacterium]